MDVKNSRGPSKKIALGMSGGVDSSLCAHLLVEQGYEVTGVFLECWRAPGCRTDQDRKDALQVALELGIPFKVLDFKKTYKEKVVENFFDEYEAGRTPNPDILCNKEIKFGLFYDWAMAEGFDAVATGHYAKISKPDGKPTLTIPKDKHKDQTYFLYLLTEEQLQHVIFPLSDIRKKDVRAEAQKRQIPVADKKDSVGICFIGDINVHSFLKERLGEHPGEVIDVDGNVIGKHKGLWFYTVGQRHGFEIDKRTLITTKDGQTIQRDNFPPHYVIEKLPEKNQLMVGFGAQTRKKKIHLHSIHLIDTQTALNGLKKYAEKGSLLARIRHTGDLLPIAGMTQKASGVTITLVDPASGVAEGQSLVFYRQKKDEIHCLGGGVIA